MSARACPPRFALLLVAALLGSGCAWMHRPDGRRIDRFPEVRTHAARGVVFQVVHLPEDTAVVDQVAAALTVAAEKVDGWGAFTSEVEVRIYPDHASLELALGRYDYPWLRAWARYDEIYLQSPASWGLFEGGASNLTELLTHELVHCLMYQLAAQRSAWLEKDRQIPIWFREGMASWTARQGHRRMSEGRLAAWVRRHGHDPVGQAPGLYQRDSEPVYAAAHWAFAFLVERYGPDRVRSLLAAMREGAGFSDAFRAWMGLPPRDFELEFFRYLRWEGWRDRAHPGPDDLLRASDPSRAGAA